MSTWLLRQHSPSIRAGYRPPVAGTVPVFEISSENFPGMFYFVSRPRFPKQFLMLENVAVA